MEGVHVRNLKVKLEGIVLYMAEEYRVLVEGGIYESIKNGFFGFLRNLLYYLWPTSHPYM